jgi:ADP-ribose pyrophosphatase
VTTGFRRLDEQLVHRGAIWSVVTATFTAPDGSTFARDIVRSPGAVAVVPVLFDPDGIASVVVVRQFRPALDGELVEIPAGMRDVAGEEPDVTARRELAEEVGLAAATLELLIVFHNSAGMTDATTHVFLATGLTRVPSEAHGPEEESMSVHQVPLADLVADVERGVITDAKTAIGVLLTHARLVAET